MVQSVLFTKEECDKIISKANELKVICYDGGWKDNPNINFVNYELKNSKDTKWIFDRLLNFLKLNIEEELISEPKFIDLLKYGVNDGFELHKDSFFNRKYAVGTILNEDFKGGDFIVNTSKGPFKVKKKVGNSYIFDVTLYHEVKKIKSGERWSLIMFVLNNNLNRNFISII